jgi:hypothetical protein
VVKKSDRVTYHDMCTIKDFVSCRLAVSSNFLFTGINNRGRVEWNWKVVPGLPVCLSILS